MSEDLNSLSRSAKYKKRKIKKKEQPTDGLIKILNFLISIVILLIIASLIIIFTNSEVKSRILNKDEAKNVEQPLKSNTDVNFNAQNYAQNQASASIESKTEEKAAAEVDVKEQLKYIKAVESNDPNVIIAWIDSRWTPLTTEQTGVHQNQLDVNHIDFQEKVKLVYRDTGFTATDSIIWNVKTINDNAIAVISSKNQKHIFRLTMTWIDGKGWQTVLIEQLHSLENAY